MTFDIFSSTEKQNTDAVEDGIEVTTDRVLPPGLSSVVEIDVSQNEMSRSNKARLERLERFRNDLDDNSYATSQSIRASQTAEKHIAGVQALLNDTRAEIELRANLEAENSSLQREVASLKEELERERSAKAKETSLVTTLKSRLTETREGLQRAHVEAAGQARQIEALQAHVKEHKSRNQAHEIETRMLSEQRDALEAALASTKDDLGTTHSELRDAREDLRAAKAKIEDLKTLIEADIHHREKLNLELETVRDAMQELQAHSQNISSQYELAVSDLEMRSSEFSQKLKTKDASILSLELLLEKQEAENRRVELELEKRAIQTVDLERKLKLEISRRQSAVDELSDALKAQEAEREIALRHVTLASKKDGLLAELKEEKSILLRETKLVSKEHQAVVKENKTLGREVKKLTQAQARLEKQLKRAETASATKPKRSSVSKRKTA